MRAQPLQHPLLRPLLVLAMIVGLLATGLRPAAADHDFADVPDDHPFHDAISWLVGEGVATGYPDGTFRPAVDVTRQAAAAFLYRMAGEPDVARFSDFTDVPSDHPFHDAIAWAADQGITTGYPDGTFRPGVDVTRQAAAAFIFRAVGEPTGDRDSAFSDVPESHPFHEPISWMASEEIANGYPDGTFRPSVDVTRQAIAAFLQRTVDAGYGVASGVLTLTLTPESAEVRTHEEHTLTATIEDSLGAPVDDGTLVRFLISGLIDETVATEDGAAELTYGLAQDEWAEGRQDLVVACVVAEVAGDCGTVGDEASVTWVPGPEGHIAGTDVLYFVDRTSDPDHLGLGLQTLADEGIIDLTVAASREDARSRMGDEHDVLMYFNQGGGLPNDDVTALVDLVGGGQRAIVADWLGDADVLAALDAQVGTTTNESPTTLLDDRLSADIANPMALTNPEDHWGTWSRGLAPAGGGMSLCSFASGDSCAISGNEGRTLALSFLSDTVPADDARNLARNLLRIVMEEPTLDERIAGAEVLYFADAVQGDDAMLAGLQELAGEGVIGLTVAGSREDARDQLAADTHDVAFYFNQGGAIPPADIEALSTWVAAGKAAVYADWFMADTDALAAFEIEPGTTTNELEATFSDQRLAFGVTNPLGLSNPGWGGAFARGLAPADGTDAVSLCVHPSGDSCAVSGNDGRTLALSFLSDTFPTEEGRHLARNVLRVVLEDADLG